MLPARRILSLLPLFFFVAVAARGDDPAKKQGENGLTPPVQMSAKEDHQRIMGLLRIRDLRSGADGRDPKAPNATNYDEAKANPYPNLPDPLIMKNGGLVADAETWWKRQGQRALWVIWADLRLA